MIRLNPAEARRLALASQCFPASGPQGPEATRQLIEQLGYIQIDTISVVERAHHHVLWSRLPDYQTSWLQQLEEERAVFEYWAHAASYLPMSDYRFSLPRKIAFQNGHEVWFEKDHRLVDYVFDRIRREGPLMSRDLLEPGSNLRASNSNGMDWTRNPLNLALRMLFMEGKIMVAGRRGFQKTYDLPERVLPAGTDTRPPAREEYLQHLIKRDLRAHGLMRRREFGYLLKGIGPDLNRLLSEMRDSGQLVEVQVEGAGEEPYFLDPRLLETVPARPAERLIILSPFDNLVIQRRRLRDLFGFSYQLECYVPAPKRQFGYFGLPLLWKEQFLGQLDLKADRKTKVLQVKNAAFEKGAFEPEELKKYLQEALRQFAVFNGCQEIQAEAVAAKAFKGAGFKRLL